jgi:hypothetical protein
MYRVRYTEVLYSKYFSLELKNLSNFLRNWHSTLKNNNLPLTPEYKTMLKNFQFLVIQNRITVNTQKILCAKN